MIKRLDSDQIALLKKRHKKEKSGDVRDRIKVDRITDNFASGSKSIFILKEYRA